MLRNVLVPHSQSWTSTSHSGARVLCADQLSTAWCRSCMQTRRRRRQCASGSLRRTRRSGTAAASHDVGSAGHGAHDGGPVVGGGHRSAVPSRATPWRCGSHRRRSGWRSFSKSVCLPPNLPSMPGTVLAPAHSMLPRTRPVPCSLAPAPSHQPCPCPFAPALSVVPHGRAMSCFARCRCRRPTSHGAHLLPRHPDRLPDRAV